MLLQKLIIIVTHINKTFQLLFYFSVSSVPFIYDLDFIVYFVYIVVFCAHTFLSTVSANRFCEIIRIDFIVILRHLLNLKSSLLNNTIKFEIAVSLLAWTFIYSQFAWVSLILLIFVNLCIA